MSSHSSPVGSDPLSARVHQLEELLDEIAAAAKSTDSAADFYRLLVERIVPAIGAAGAAVWTSASSDQAPRLECHAAKGPASVGDWNAHRKSAAEVLAAGQPRTISLDGQRTLVFHPFSATTKPIGALELVSAGPLSAGEARGYLRVLAALVEVADDFHRGRELAERRKREGTWQQQDRFARNVHASLDTRQTSFVIANEGRQTVDCDRLSVLVCRGSKCLAEAISGVDVLDRRAKVVRLLETLATRAVASGEPLWYSEGTADLPAEIEVPLHEFLDESHSRTLAVLPLYAAEPNDNPTSRAPIGVLVAEWFKATSTPLEVRESLVAIADHCGVALRNSLVHTQLPLSSLGRALSRFKPITQARNLPKTVLVLAAASLLVAAAVLVPANFDIEVRGELQPRLRRDVFASDDGVVQELLITHGQNVQAGEKLIQLRKPELDLEFSRVLGEIQTAQAKLASIRAERLTNAPVTGEARRTPARLAAEEEELKQMLLGLQSQREILDRQRDELSIDSPMAGQLLTWNAKELLQARPVQRGQTLLTIGDLNGPWELVLHVPDYRAGHVLAAQQALHKDLDVTFALAADPGEQYEGKIDEVALATELDDTNGSTLTANVAFDRADVKGLRPGATVVARIHCGQRSIGYVWLHDLFEAVQSHWWW